MRHANAFPYLSAPKRAIKSWKQPEEQIKLFGLFFAISESISLGEQVGSLFLGFLINLEYGKEHTKRDIF